MKVPQFSMLIPTWRALALFVMLELAFLIPGFGGLPALIIFTLISTAEYLRLLPWRHLGCQTGDGSLILGNQGSLQLFWHDTSDGSRARAWTTTGIHLRVPLPPGLGGDRYTSFSVSRGTELPAQEIPLHGSNRGVYRLQHCYLRISSPWSLYEIQRGLSFDVSLTVLPDLKDLRTQLRLRRRELRLNWGSDRTDPSSPAGDFDSLKDYQDGDDASRIHWPSSTRVQRPVVKCYTRESSGWVTVILDAGRWMLGRSDELSHFDRTLNALTVFSGTVFAGGDQLRLITVSDRIISDRLFTPRRSDRRELSRHLAALHPQDREFSLPQALDALRSKAHRMSALVIITQFLETDDREYWTENLVYYSRKSSLTLCALRDPALDRLIARPVRPGSEIAFAAASDIYAGRQRDLAAIRNTGIRTLDCTAAELGPKLQRIRWS